MMIIREMHHGERHMLRDFLYDAIFVPDGMLPPDKSIIERPELQVYIEDFGCRESDKCLAAEVNGEIAGAVWTRIMHDYGHIDDDTPSLAVSVKRNHRRQGIGTALIKEMINCIRQSGYTRASLSVQKANYAVKMYMKLGFEIFSENDEEYIMLIKL